MVLLCLGTGGSLSCLLLTHSFSSVHLWSDERQSDRKDRRERSEFFSGVKGNQIGKTGERFEVTHFLVCWQMLFTWILTFLLASIVVVNDER